MPPVSVQESVLATQIAGLIVGVPVEVANGDTVLAAIGKLQSLINALDTRLDTAEADIVALEGRVTITEADVALLQSAGDVVDLTYSASLDWDMNDGYMFRVTLTGDTELQLPANLKPGTHIMYVYQDAIGGHIMTFQTGYRAPRGLLPVLSTIPGGVDILTFVSDGVKVDVNIQANMLEG